MIRTFKRHYSKGGIVSLGKWTIQFDSNGEFKTTDAALADKLSTMNSWPDFISEVLPENTKEDKISESVPVIDNTPPEEIAAEEAVNLIDKLKTLSTSKPKK